MTKDRICFWKLAAIVTVLLAFMVTTACSSKFPGQTSVDTSADTVKADTSTDSENTTSSSLPANNMLRSNTDGEVTIDVKYLGYKDNLLSFDIIMDTHLGDLDQYDLAKLSELTDDKGNKYPPVSWDSAPGGHHRTGILTFSQPGTKGEPGTLILIIRNVAGIQERMFKWENLSSNS